MPNNVRRSLTLEAMTEMKYPFLENEQKFIEACLNAFITNEETGKQNWEKKTGKKWLAILLTYNF